MQPHSQKREVDLEVGPDALVCVISVGSRRIVRVGSDQFHLLPLTRETLVEAGV